MFGPSPRGGLGKQAFRLDNPEDVRLNFLTARGVVVYLPVPRTTGSAWLQALPVCSWRFWVPRFHGPRRDGGSRWNGWVARWTLERFGQRRAEMKAALRRMGFLAGTLKRRSGRGPSWRYLSGFD